MRPLFHILLMSLFSLVLAACASGNKIPREIVNDAFLTDIKEDGSKLFIYFANFRGGKQRPWPMGTRITTNQQTPVRSASTIRSDQAERREKLAIQAIEIKLRNNGFCRTGYFILSSYVEFGTAEIRAECKESATQADRDLFL